ncbi:ATP-binding protein [Nonomuraea sp. NPDC049750]|uniref:ATP-binding protein n=1 Tax=Nonomuraea sp. NPDC049750 TaxID=3154738 RepID=UPI0033C66ED0
MAKTADDQFVNCIPLPAMASSVPTARMHTRALMAKWHLTHVVDDAELIVSEIVTNAIRATNIIPSQARYTELYDRMEVVCLYLYLLTPELVIEVWDPKREPPRRHDATLDDEGGRGLFLVESLSQRWGIRWPPTGGKIVWAGLALGAT